MNEKRRMKALGNVGVLDIRNATEASIAGIASIGNVGKVLYSDETAGLLQRLNVDNLGKSLKIPDGVKLRRGEIRFTHDQFWPAETPESIYVDGTAVFDSDVTAEDIEHGLGELHVNGTLVCPAHLLGAIQSKLQELNGTAVTYSLPAEIALGRLVLDEHALNALADDVELVVLGSLLASQALSNELLTRKVRRLNIIGKIRCHEANADALKNRLADKSTKMTIIPLGYQVVERPLVLDTGLLESLKDAKLYCRARVQVEPDVSPETLDAHLDALLCEDIVFCPVALRGILTKKCNVLETRVVFYEGKLWVAEDVSELSASMLKYLEGKLTLAAMDVLTISPDVEPNLLAEKIAKVHNFDLIRGTSDQLGLIQNRMGINEGILQNTAETEDSTGGMGNVGYLTL